MDGEIKIAGLRDLVDLVREFRKSGAWVFRGLRQSDYALKPKIGRDDTRRMLGMGAKLPYDPEGEERLIRHFIRSAAPYVRNVPKSKLEWLALAQHHGLSTRLLDWTQSLLVAAWFAVEDSRNRDLPPMIYAAEGIPVVDDQSIQNEVKLQDDVMLYYPPHISPRITAQSGLFTVHKFPDKAFVPQNGVRIIIGPGPLTLKLDLNACGIHRASLFPDIDGLAEYHSWLYKWGLHLPYASPKVHKRGPSLSRSRRK